MEAAVYFSGTHSAAAPSTLTTSFINGRDASLRGRGASGVFSTPSFLIQARDLVTISGPVFIVGDHDTFLPSGRFTVVDAPSHYNSQGAPPGNPVLHITIPALATQEEPLQTAIIPAITPSPFSSALSQLGAESALGGPLGPCPINTTPLDQQQSSYEECQRTIAPGGICCIPGVPDPSDLPSSKTTATTPASVPASSTTTSSSSSVKSPSLLTTPTNQHTSSTLPPTPSSAPASKPSNPAPEPTEVVPPKAKTPIIPILIPCSLAAVGIVAFGIWCTIWRSRGPRYPPPPSVSMEPRVANGQKVFEAGNFAGAEAFERGIEEMGKKEKASDEGRGRWKPGGYRKYRESGTSSGLFGKSA